MDTPHLISTLVLVALGVGIALRRRRRVHPRVMLGAFLVDLGLLIWIEMRHHVMRQAAEAAGIVQGEVEHTEMLDFHIWVSTIMLVLYVVVITLGIRLLRGHERIRSLHRNCAIAFLVFRLTNWVTSFLV